MCFILFIKGKAMIMQLNIVTLLLSKQEKLLVRFLQQPKDFHFDEMTKLLGYYSFTAVKKGKTSGSRVKFVNAEGLVILLHKPHPGGIMKMYQLKQIKEILGL
ncbi:MAG: type II toxin-antitoxin system HicA family toxin [Flavobacteriales bacterium]|nr:type II toxin-antitoxin system HicA family toxin [Flavobacteriales bacterium]